MSNSTTPLQSSLKYDGVNQRDQVAFYENVRDLLNQCRSITISTAGMVNEIKTDHNTLRTDLTNWRTSYNSLCTSAKLKTSVSGSYNIAALAASTITSAALATVTASTLSLLKA